MKTLVVDGKQISVEPGTLLYDAAVASGAHIPALCRHEGLPHEGACRVCVVELVRRGTSRLVASCMFPVNEDGLEVLTDSPRVREARRFVIRLLLRRNASSPVIQQLAREEGVEPDERLSPYDGELCIRCGRCVRACALDGTDALGFANAIGVAVDMVTQKSLEKIREDFARVSAGHPPGPPQVVAL